MWCFISPGSIGHVSWALVKNSQSSVYWVLVLMGFSVKQIENQYKEVNLWSFCFRLKSAERKSILISSIYWKKIYGDIKEATNKPVNEFQKAKGEGLECVHICLQIP